MGKFYKGVTFDADNWDGSDIFLPKDTWGISVTRKVAEKIKEHKLTNVIFKNFADITTFVDWVPGSFPE